MFSASMASSPLNEAFWRKPTMRTRAPNRMRPTAARSRPRVADTGTFNGPLTAPASWMGKASIEGHGLGAEKD